MERIEDRRLFAATLISIGLNGQAANGDSGESSVSADGRFVAFSSYASNLAAGDTNGRKDVFLTDRQSGTTTLISRNPTTGEIGNADSNQPVISQDGNYVAFVSRASNLLSNDSRGFPDVFRYNVQTHALELVSAANAAGTIFASGGSSEPTISGDGQYISFTCFGGNLGPVDTNAANDVYIRDMVSKTNRLVSVNKAGTRSGNALSFDSWLSRDGRYVTFRSDARDLVTNDTNETRDTFLRDLQTGSTTLVSVNSSGLSGNAASDSNSVSGDGRYVLFQSKASDLVINDTNGTSDVFLRDTQANTTRLLTVNRFGSNSAGGFSEFPAMSQDGSYASFSSYAPDIVTGDLNAREDVFLRDLKHGPLALVSATASGSSSNGRSFDPFISQNGDFVVFTSDATNLTSAAATAGKSNVYLAATPAPNMTTDTSPPTVTFGALQPINPGATSVTFTVALSDDVGLDTVTVGNLLVGAPSGGTLQATLISVAGTGKTAVATYRVDLGSPVEQHTGVYTVIVPADTIHDAAGNAAAAGNIGVFNLTTTSGGDGSGSTIGDPNGPNLVIVSPGKVPTEAIGDRRGKFKFRVQNLGPGILSKRTVKVAVYLSSDTTLDVSDTVLTTVTKKLKLKVGKSGKVGARFTYPTTIGDGSYYLLAQADSDNTVAESNESDNVRPSATTILVRQPFVDLEPTFVSKPSQFAAGMNVSVTATIRNNGNVMLKSAVPIKLVLTTDGQVNDSSVELSTVTSILRIGAGKSRALRFKAMLPASLLAGTYQIGVDADASNLIAESDEGNNIATSFTIQL